MTSSDFFAIPGRGQRPRLQLLLQQNWLCGFSKNLAETWIVAQRIAPGRKLALALGQPRWDFHNNLELLDSVAATLPIELKRPLGASAFVFLL